LGVNINIDSLSNLGKIWCTSMETLTLVGVRVRPNIMAGGNLKISTGHDKSKFGIPYTQLASINSPSSKIQRLIFIRLHIHTGSEIKDVKSFYNLPTVFEQYASAHFPTVKVLDFGGGFKVPYQPDEKGTDIALLGAEVNQFMQKIVGSS
jgi:diaminopimelate decarboxylase